MNKELVKAYIDAQPIKVIKSLDLDREKLEYDKIAQCQRRTDAKPEELCRAFLLTKLVNELGYAPERIEIGREYTAGRRTRKEIATYLGIESVSYAITQYVQPLLRTGQLRMTLPDKPKSAKQQFVANEQ